MNFSGEGGLKRKVAGLFISSTFVEVFLFSDVLVWASKAMRFKGMLDLVGAFILPVNPNDIDADDRDDSAQRSLHIINPVMNTMITLTFPDLVTRESWAEDLIVRIKAGWETL